MKRRVELRAKRDRTKSARRSSSGRWNERESRKFRLDATGSRDVLGPDEVRRTGARDLNDLIQYLPAVSTRPYNGGESSAPSFSIRGLPDDGLTEYILIQIDGVPANPMPYGWTAFSFFPLLTEQVHAIDLIRGGYSVRHSPNTVGGVLNSDHRSDPARRKLSVSLDPGLPWLREPPVSDGRRQRRVRLAGLGGGPQWRRVPDRRRFRRPGVRPADALDVRRAGLAHLSHLLHRERAPSARRPDLGRLRAGSIREHPTSKSISWASHRDRCRAARRGKGRLGGVVRLAFADTAKPDARI